MIDDLLRETEDRMKKTIEALQSDLVSIRTGRATPALLDRVRVDYYGAPTPLNQVASVSAPEPRLLVIRPWDASALGAIVLLWLIWRVAFWLARLPRRRREAVLRTRDRHVGAHAGVLAAQ